MSIVTYDEILSRFSAVGDYGNTVVTSHYLLYAENHVNGLLAGHFTVPFSSNNLTAKDLVIELTYLRCGDLKVGELEKRYDMFQRRIDALRNGDEVMMTSSGETMVAGGTLIPTSNTEDYTPVFGVSDTELSQVDPDQIEDEEDERETW